MRIGRVGQFDSTNTLHYPGTTASDLRLVYDTLLTPAADEPASYYALLAEGVQVSDDLTTARFRIDDRARWHDGQPVTSADVVFTFQTLKSQGAPYYRQALRHISVAAEGERVVTFTNAHAGQREFVGTVATLPIHPRHYWEDDGVGDVSARIPLGSGPYRVASVDIAKGLVLERVADYWGRDLPVNRGRWNFDTIRVGYYRDNSVALQAFLKGDLDLREERSARDWAGGYTNEAVRRGDIVMSRFAAPGMGRIQSLIFNLRRPLFQDIRVRRALAIAFDADWVRKNLFSGLYGRADSMYAQTRFAARGAADARVRALLEPFAESLPEGIFGPDVLAREQFEGRRQRLARADELLRQAGFEVRDGRRIDPATGKPVQIEVVHLEPQVSRVLSPYAEALEKLGIRLIVRSLEPVTARRRMLDHDFDMTVYGWAPSSMPGRAERLLWHSALARRAGSYALAGAEDAALDAAIEAMGAARSMDVLEPAARAFDRVLRARRYVIPMWRSDATWIAHARDLAHPRAAAIAPSYLDRWWFAPPRQP